MTFVHGVVIVLFEPDRLALANVERARAMTQNVLVVDNSASPDAKVHVALQEQGIAVLANQNSGGLAGAYNRGAALLFDQGCDLCFFLDQDSVISDGYFERMSRAAAEVKSDAFLIGPRIYETRRGAFFPEWATDEFAAAATAQVHPVASLISSGSGLSADAFRRLGAFREDFFIEAVDIEYCLRAEREGIPVLVNVGEVLLQTTGAITRHGCFFTTNHAAWRRYYLVRNAAWTTRRYQGSRIALLRTSRLLMRELLVIALFEQSKLRKTRAVMAGAIDGGLGRLGPVEKIRPALWRYCTRSS